MSCTFSNLIATTTPKLASIGFTKSDECPWGATFLRADGAKIVFSSGRFLKDFSVVLYTDANTPKGGWLPDLLMAVIDPARADCCKQTCERSTSMDASAVWTDCFIEFLIARHSTIFASPFDQRILQDYQSRLRDDLRALGLPESEEL